VIAPAAHRVGWFEAFIGEALSLRLFPIPPAEESRRFEGRCVDIVEAAGVDAEPVRLRAGYVEGVHSAMRAKGVLRHASPECIGSQCMFAFEQLEVGRIDAEVQDPFLRADRTVAFRQPLEIDAGAEPHPAAMATALTGFYHRILP
jgi:hypothetical protein